MSEDAVDAINAMAKARRELAAYSRDTGVSKHGDLTRMDRTIAGMVTAEDERMFAKQQAEQRRSRER